MTICVGPEFFMLLRCSDYDAAVDFANDWSSRTIDTELRKKDLTMEHVAKKR